MPEIQRLRLDHGPAVLAFEEDNRAYFAASIPDRGDDFFVNFDDRHRELLAEQDAGGCHYHVLVEDGGEVVGRINLVGISDGSAELGFRIAEKSAGRGLAQDAVRQICELAVTEYGLTTLWAKATLDNARSRAVLARTGFVRTGEIVLNGRPAITLAKALS